jgi:hypothetical protein
MRIQDNDSVSNVTDPVEIEAALSKRHVAGRNSFWLSHGAELFPVINIMVKGDLAYLDYFPSEGHPGFASVGGSLHLSPGEHSTFFPDHTNETLQIMNEAIVPFPDALKAAQEFAISATMPRCIQWFEL